MKTMRQIMALLLSAALLTTCPQMDGAAAENMVLSESPKMVEQPETENFGTDEAEQAEGDESFQTALESL